MLPLAQRAFTLPQITLASSQNKLPHGGVNFIFHGSSVLLRDGELAGLEQFVRFGGVEASFAPGLVGRIPRPALRLKCQGFREIMLSAFPF